MSIREMIEVKLGQAIQGWQSKETKTDNKIDSVREQVSHLDTRIRELETRVSDRSNTLSALEQIFESRGK